MTERSCWTSTRRPIREAPLGRWAGLLREGIALVGADTPTGAWMVEQRRQPDASQW